MTMFGYCSRTGSSRSFSRKCASSSPTSFDSSFASAMRDGATNRFGWVDGTMMSAKPQSCSADRVVDASRDLPDVEIRHRAVRLRIEVDEKRGLASKRKGRRQVDGGRGLPHAPFLVCDGDNHRLNGGDPAPRLARRSRGPYAPLPLLAIASIGRCRLGAIVGPN